MKQSQMLIPTLEDLPTTDEPHFYVLVRAGYIRQFASGSYCYLPLAHRVIEKIKGIIREELADIGGQEILLSSQQFSEIWQKDPEIYETEKVTEDPFVTLLTQDIYSSTQLPLHLFQFQTKLREKSPIRFGWLKSQEYLLQEGRSFHENEGNLEDFFRRYEEVYRRIFARCKIEVREINGNDAAKGIAEAKEFIAVSEIGEETFFYSTESDYAAHKEIAASQYIPKRLHASIGELEKKSAPDADSLIAAADYFEVDYKKAVRAELFLADGRPVMILTRGDHQVNPNKVRKYLQADRFIKISDEKISSYINADPVTAGPVNLPETIELYADHYVKDVTNGMVGANTNHQWFLNVDPKRDFQPKAFGDFRFAEIGEISPDGQGVLAIARGIRLSRLFKKAKSTEMKALALNEAEESISFALGCYELDVNHLFAAIVEQYADEEGLHWPDEIAPFAVHLLQFDVADLAQSQLVAELEASLTERGYDVLIDDRNMATDRKIKDADLIGCPLRLSVGEKAAEGIVEITIKHTGAMVEVRKEELFDTLAILSGSEE